jgi:hypothetical protein
MNNLLKMCVINCLLIFLIFRFLAMPRGGELSSFKDPGAGNLLPEKNTNPMGIALGGVGEMVTKGIDACINSKNTPIVGSLYCSLYLLTEYYYNYPKCTFKLCNLNGN